MNESDGAGSSPSSWCRPRPPVYPACYLAAAAALWLWPFFLAGWKGRTYQALPGAVALQYHAAGLSTRRSETWSVHHIEVRLLDGTRREIEDRALFPGDAFGRRTRMDHVLDGAALYPSGSHIRDRLADYVASRIAGGAVAELDPGAVAEILIVRSVWPAGSPELASPAGAWAPPPSNNLPRERRVDLGTWRYSQGRAFATQAPSSAPDEKPDQIPGSPVRRRIVFPPSDDAGSGQGREVGTRGR